MKRRDQPSAFSGINGGVQTQDLAMVESMGVIEDRSKEHLGASDLAIIAWRERLVAGVRDFVDHDTLMAINPPADYRAIRAVSALIPKGSDWKEVMWNAVQPVTS